MRLEFEKLVDAPTVAGVWLLCLMCAVLLSACGDTSPSIGTVTPTDTPLARLSDSPTLAPTKTPPPTVTPSPTSATRSPIPTATSSPTPTATPSPTSASFASLSIDERTLGHELVAVFTETEASCIRNELGEEAFKVYQEQPVLNRYMEFGMFPGSCLTEAAGIELSIALAVAATSGLSAESNRCLREVYTDSGTEAIGAIPGSEFPAPSADLREVLRFSLRFSLCLTDEEADVLRSRHWDTGLPIPSDLRCIFGRAKVDQFSTFLLIRLSKPDSPEVLKAGQSLYAAADFCGVHDFASLFE